jgi:hypothetical protein
VLKQDHIPYILACHPQIDPDPVTDPANHFDADPDADLDYQNDADPCGSGFTTLLSSYNTLSKPVIVLYIS